MNQIPYSHSKTDREVAQECRNEKNPNMRKPQITEWINNAAEATARLEDLVEHLSKQINPVLKPGISEPDQEPICPMPADPLIAPVAEDLRSLTRRIEGLSSRISAILSDIEV